jgi:hypothetical protein
MRSLRRCRVFDTPDIKILNRVHAACWEWFEVREPVRDRTYDPDRQEKLRRLVFAFGRRNHLDYDLLYKVVLENLTIMSLPVETIEPKKRGRRIKVLPRPIRKRVVRKRRRRDD